MKNILYTGWIREATNSSLDDILWLQSVTYIDSSNPHLTPWDKMEWDHERDETTYPLADVLKSDISNKQVSVSYWITDKQCTKDEAQEQFLKKLYGSADCKFKSHYGDITGYLWSDENLVIGGHDLLQELRSNIDKFLVLDITVHD